MKQALRQIAAVAAALILFCVVSRLLTGNELDVWLRLPAGIGETEEMRLQQETEGVVRLDPPQRRGAFLVVPVTALQPGETWLDVYIGEEPVMMAKLRVGRFHTVYDELNGNYTGDWTVLAAVTLFWLAISLVMGWHFFGSRGPAFYRLDTIYYAGFGLFAAVSFLSVLQPAAAHLVNPGETPMLTVYSVIQHASRFFMTVTMPLVAAFAVAMAASNIALLRHERFRVQNVLGLLIAFGLIAGEALGIWLFSGFFSGSEWEARLHSTLENVYATAFVYFECVLAGSVICGLLAARHRPRGEWDCIVILGCWFRPDGSLPPLLRGRVDRAVRFWREQRERTGHAALLIPTGGRGRDEPMPEGEAIRRYLVAEGVPEDCIRAECEAANTWQNMTNSRAIIEGELPGARTLFATTNYHVFRSGVLAAEAGLPAEGIGSRTKWWFWPNAFMRECAGLLLKRWKQELAALVVLTGLFALLSMLL